jgi:acyl-phosphate glycerol 3-phosphate acyltransferase
VGFVLFVVSYLFGAVPFGLLLGFLTGKDVRLFGSKNIGATNVWRVCGAGFGVLTFVFDFLKGYVPVVFLPGLLSVELPFPYSGIVAAAGAVAGHNFPVWLRFRGGKGVATSAGAVAGLMWLPFVAAISVFVVTVAVSRYLSLGSLVACAALVVGVVVLGDEPFGSGLPLLVLSVLLAVMLFVRHRANIHRILNGTENRFPPPKNI